MENDLTSIIVTAYIQEPFQAHMTMACLRNITAFTDPNDYELILMSDSEKFPVRDDYKVLKIDKYVKTNGLSYTQSLNRGAKLAKGGYLCFIQNDVFVWDEWLEILKEYVLRNIADCVVPDQVPRSYEFTQKTKFFDIDDQEALQGSRDEGLLFMTADAYKTMGGFNESLTILQARDLWERMSNKGIRQIDTCKTMITHIQAATNLARLHRDPEGYDRMMRKDSEILNK